MSRQSKRYEYAERSIERARRILHSMPEVTTALGARAVSLTNVIDCFFPAEVRWGRLVFPEEHIDGHMVPVVALSPRQRISVPPEVMRPTSSQRRRSIRRLAEWGVCDSPEACVNAVGSGPYDYVASLGGNTAHVQTEGIKHPPHGNSAKGPWVNLYGRPLVTLAYEKDERWAAPATMIHESVHVLQYGAGARQLPGGPDSQGDLWASNEDQAYSASGPFAQALQQAGLTWDSHREAVHITRWQEYANRFNPGGQQQ